MNQGFGEQDRISCIHRRLYDIRSIALKLAHFTGNRRQKLALMRTGNTGKPSLSGGGWCQKIDESAETVPDHSVSTGVPPVIHFTCATMQGATTISLLHKNPVIMIETKTRAEDAAQIRKYSRMVDQVTAGFSPQEYSRSGTLSEGSRRTGKSLIGNTI